jgi:hypothetical protein
LPTESEAEQPTTLDELLAPYAADQTMERFVCLIDDLEAMRVTALWPICPKQWVRPRRAKPVDVNEAWAWLWEGCVFDEIAYAEMVDLPLRRLNAKITMLASARILFPDGTLPSGARLLLQGRIRQEVRRFSKPDKEKAG